MNVRVVIGVILIVLSALVLSTMLMMSGYEFETERGWLRMPVGVLVLFGLPALVVLFVGGFIMGSRLWQPACGWALLAVAVTGISMLAGVHSIYDSPDMVAMMEAMSAERGEPPPRFRVDWAPPLVLFAVLVAVSATLLLSWVRTRRRDRSSAADGEVIDPSVRPAVVTVFAWFTIVTSVLGFLSAVWNFQFNLADMQDILAEYTGVPSTIQWVYTIAVLVAQVVFAAFVLRGRNWARWGMVGLLCFGLVYSLVTMGFHGWLIPSLAWLGIMVMCLFVPPSVRAWFSYQANQ